MRTRTSALPGEGAPGPGLSEAEGESNVPARPLLRQETRLTALLYALFLGILALGHWRPQLAYPEMGVYLAAAMGGTLALTLLLGWASGTLRALACWSMGVFLALLVWTTLSFAWSVLPVEGLDVMGTWVEGYWVFCASLLAWRVASAASVPLGGREQWVTPAGKNSSGAMAGGNARREISFVPLGESDLHRQEPAPLFAVSSRRMAAGMMFGFLAVVAIAGAIKGVDQFLFSYDRELAAIESAPPTADERLNAGIRHALREKRVAAWYGNPNVHCYILAMGLPFLLGLIAASRRFWSQALWGVSLLPVAAAAYWTKSRGGWLAVALVLILAAIVIGRRRWKRTGLTVVYVACLGLACGLMFVYMSPAKIRQSSPDQPPVRERVEAGFWKRLTRVSTVGERLHYLTAAFRQIARAPLLGNGLGSYGVLYARTRPEGAGESRYAHNAPAQLWAEGGVPAVALMVALFAMALGAGAGGGRWRQWDEEWLSAKQASVLPLFGMGAASLAVFGFGSLVDFAFYQREFFLDGCLLMGWLVALRQEKARGVETEGETTAAPPKARWKEGTLLAVWIAANVAGGYWFLIQPMRARAAADLGDAYVTQAAAASNASKKTEWIREALIQFQRASAIQGNDYHTIDAQAGMYEWLGDYEAAYNLRDRAIALNRWSAQLQRSQARVLLRMNQPAQALRYADRAIELYPLNPEGHAIKAQILAQEGRTTESRALFERAAELEPYHPEKYRKNEK